MPHNFCELIEASIEHIQGRGFVLIPDFITGGSVDPTNYQAGLRGGKIRVRARIEELDKKTLIIKDIPYSTTTTSLIESIIKANDAGKIKIRKVVDNTAKDVEIQIQLMAGVSPDVTIDALYAFTDCEVSISPNACVIIKQKPEFIDVHRILAVSTDATVELLRRELEILAAELREKLLFASLEKIFIENRIYRDIEECTTFEAVIQAIHTGLSPYKAQFYRQITDEDVVRLTEIRIKRISKFDGFKADELMRAMQAELEEALNNLANLKPFAVRYFRELLKKYGKGKERKTEIRQFDVIQAAAVALANEKLYVNKEEGFIGYSLKKDEYVMDCSDLDDVIVIFRNGNYKIVKIEDKMYVGKEILHVAVFRKSDERMTYNCAYLDGESGITYVKRFNVGGVTRDKEYTITKGAKGSRLLYFSVNPNGEAETISVQLTPGCKAKIKVFDYDFANIDIKSRSSQGNTLTKHPVKKITLKSGGVSTLGSIKIHYDTTLGRLNTDGRGLVVGSFAADERILVVYKDGSYELTDFKLSNRYEPAEVLSIKKFEADTIITAVYLDGETKTNYIKRFRLDTLTMEKKFCFIATSKSSKLWCATVEPSPMLAISYKAGKDDAKQTMAATDLVEVRGWKAQGNKLSYANIKEVTVLVKAQPQAEPDAAS